MDEIPSSRFFQSDWWFLQCSAFVIKSPNVLHSNLYNQTSLKSKSSCLCLCFKRPYVQRSCILSLYLNSFFEFRNELEFNVTSPFSLNILRFVQLKTLYTLCSLSFFNSLWSWAEKRVFLDQLVNRRCCRIQILMNSKLGVNLVITNEKLANKSSMCGRGDKPWSWQPSSNLTGNQSH